MPSLDWEKESEKLSKIVVKETPFVLIARVKVKPGEVENYLKIAEEVDNAVEKSEPGMLDRKSVV